MLILSRVCADFRDPRGQVIFRIPPESRLTFLDAPEAIRSDPLFDLLLADGSLEAAVSVARQRELEADPLQDTDASGKRKAPKTAKPKESAKAPAGKAPLPGASEPAEAGAPAP